MKFLESWIRKYFKSSLNIISIINLLNKNGFEVSNNNIQNIKSNTKYIIKKKNIKIKKHKKKKYIKINYKNKDIYIKNIKENISNKYILFYKKDFLINKYFNSLKKILNKTIIYVIYSKLYILDKILKFINKNNYIEINIPNNRFDCNNIYGISNELNRLNKKKNYIKKLNIKSYNNKYNLKVKLNNNIKKKNIENIKYIVIHKTKISKYITPKWVYKKLKTLNIKIKKNLIDLINYVLIESGQKIILLDLDKIKKEKIDIYFKNKKNKKYTLYLRIQKKIIYKSLNKYNSTYFPNKNTKNILILSPLLTKKIILKKINHINKNTLFKYISNNNNYIQDIYLKYISYIIKNICQGKITKINTYKFLQHKNNIIKIKYKYIQNKIGFKIKKKKIINIIKHILCKIIKKKKEYIILKTPKWRNDLKIKEDIIEEIIKIYGYNKIPLKPPKIKFIIKNKKEDIKNIKNIKNIFTNIGYQEVINFIFTNQNKEKIFFKTNEYTKIINPINKDMSIIRKSLIPGLIETILYNIRRQQENIKIFEIGTCFKKKKNKIKQTKKISAVIYGYKNIKNWFIKNNKIFDFYDIKGDLEYILMKTNNINFLEIEKSNNKILEPQQGINIKIKNDKIGYLGMLNKKIQKKILLNKPIFLFEIKINKILYSKKNIKINIPKFQTNKRDITLILQKKILINKIINKCLKKEKKIININVIDIYKNKSLKHKNQKNITLRLFIKDNKQTLNEKQITKIVNKCKNMLKIKFKAIINN